MDFTEIYRHSSSLVAFSPGAHFLLTAVQDRLIVRRADSFTITRSWRVDSTPSAASPAFSKTQRQSAHSSSPPPDAYITHAAWSSDSEYILAASARRGVVNVYKLRDEHWNARIDAGVEGLVSAIWAPDARTILCFSEWALRVTAWSLVTGTATYIQYPTYPDRGFAFRADGRYFILAERHKSKDTIGVYDAFDSYKLARHFPAPTSSLGSLAFSPNGYLIAVWEGPLEYKLHLLTVSGDIQSTFTPDSDPGLGIRSVAWHPAGSFLAIGGWDDKIYFLDSLTWSPVATVELQQRIPADVNIWREPSDWLEKTQGRGFLSYERLQGPHSIQVNRPDHTRPPPKSGILQLEWNKTGSMFLVRFENAPSCVHLFDFPSPSEDFSPRLRSVLFHSRPVLHARWNPVRKGNFAVCCSNGALYTWSDEWVADASESGMHSQGDSVGGEEMAECIGIPAKKFETRDVRWAPDGKGLILLDKDTFCCAFEVENEDTG